MDCIKNYIFESDDKEEEPVTIRKEEQEDREDKLKEKMGEYYNPSNLLIQGYRFIESMNKDKEKSKSQPDETVAEKVILRKQEVYDDISSLEVDDSDEFIDISDMPPLEGDEE